MNSHDFIVVTGSRHWTNKEQLYEKLTSAVGEDIIIVVGYNPLKRTPKGVDQITYHWCQANRVRVIPEPADWSKGLHAGFTRNEFMIDHYKPIKVLAFRAEGKSNGTDHCVRHALRKEVPIEVTHERESKNAA